ncbi:MAG: hypothetical protein LBD24_08170 [Spirochaetaceae bacterium]|nr:hypothetical protein [Spirochaetaceae bacterium]
MVALLGAGESADAFHITAPRPDGSGAARAMRCALADAGCGPERVGYINAHGTGTVLNDRMEALAIAEVFSDRPPALSSTKPVTGHTLGAAGALELAICWMTLAEARGLPVHRWDGVPDPDIPGLVFAAPDTAPRDPLVCMSNSFAFGGCNVSIILSLRQPPAVSARPRIV